ncbi:hypothetical protein COOONC_28677 [Cooperia oncophora]
MKKHRIDMNLMVDYKPEMFLANVPKLVATAKDAELICILIAALSNERSAWCDGDAQNEAKCGVNRVTELLAEEVLKLPDDRRVEMFVVLLSALLKSSPPQVEKKAAYASCNRRGPVKVAEVSNRDPKEYVPLLNELRKRWCFSSLKLPLW